MHDLLIVLGMAVATYLTKASILLLGERVSFSMPVRRALGFVPVTVLTAIITPVMFAPHGGGAELSWRNPQLVAGAITIAVCAATRHMLLTIAIGLVAFFAWRFFMLQ